MATAQADDLLPYSAALAFYGLISVAPLVVVALWVTDAISVLSVAYVAYLRLGANFESRYASDALAAVVLLGLWLFAANTTSLVGYRAAHRRRRTPDGLTARSVSPACSAEGSVMGNLASVAVASSNPLLWVYGQ